MRRAGTWTLVVAALISVAGGAVADVAGAHGDEGIVELIGDEVVAGEDDLHRLELTVSIRHPEDDHLALDATVRLTGTSSTGVAVLPQTLGLTDEPGEYAGTVDLVGGTTWDLTVQSAQPEGRLDLRVDPDAGQVTTLGATATEPAHSERAWDRLRWLALGCGITAVLALVTLLRRRARRRTAPPADVR